MPDRLLKTLENMEEIMLNSSEFSHHHHPSGVNFVGNNHQMWIFRLIKSRHNEAN